tara:strand:- start:182 stop:445 length:264 start_codon:yes stop_codon:yes gene_type:complete
VFSDVLAAVFAVPRCLQYQCHDAAGGFRIIDTATEHAADAASLALIKGHYVPHARIGLANLGKIYLEPDQDSCVEALARLLAAEALE